MTTVIHPATVEDLWEQSRKGRCELVQGEIRMMAPAGGEHGVTIINLSTPLAIHVKAHDLGFVFGSETGFILSRNPDTVRAPDIAFVSKARIPTEGIPKKFFQGPPDLAVEVVSPGDTHNEVEEKVAEWLNAGTRLVRGRQPESADRDDVHLDGGGDNSRGGRGVDWGRCRAGV